MDTRQLSVTAWAFARMGHFIDPPYRAVEKEFLQRGAEAFNPEERYFLLEAFHAFRSNIPPDPQSPDAENIGLQLLTVLEGPGADFERALSPVSSPQRTPPSSTPRSAAEFSSPGSSRKHRSESGSWARPRVPG